MTNNVNEMKFLSHLIQNAPQVMWFLGAGTSRTAGMPTATDIIWDLKRRYYCLRENQDIGMHDISNKAIKCKIQAFLDSKGFPAQGSAEEYSFYFDLSFGADYSAQQKYINAQLNSQNISLNIGHRVLAALLELGLTKIIFTTNFDEVIETAFSNVTGKSLSSFHLEGSYAALDALNSEQFPIYAKLHGDFRYKSIKNLTADLLRNDEQIQKCFLAASNRYGLIVTGYSGRDPNVMAMFSEALQQINPFPLGLFWITPRLADVAASVSALIAAAREKGVNAHIIETGTFDILLSKIWRQLSDKPESLDLKVRTAKAQAVSIPLPLPGKRYPILRTNALAITECPAECSTVDYSEPVTFHKLNDMKREHQPNAVLTLTDEILFWGSTSEIYKIFDKDQVRAINSHRFEDSVASIAQSGAIKSFFEEALAQALCHDKPLLLRRRNKTYYAIVNQKEVTHPLLQPLKDAVGFKGKPGSLTGSVPKLKDAFWAEALSIRLEERSGLLWLLIRPDIWITPMSLRENATDFLRSKKIYRWNNQSYQLLDAWIRVLFGFIGDGQEVQVSCFLDADHVPMFRINTRTAYSFGGGANE